MLCPKCNTETIVLSAGTYVSMPGLPNLSPGSGQPKSTYLLYCKPCNMAIEILVIKNEQFLPYWRKIIESRLQEYK